MRGQTTLAGSAITSYLASRSVLEWNTCQLVTNSKLKKTATTTHAPILGTD